MEYKFDDNNDYLLLIYDKNRLINMIAIPPCNGYRIDIFDHNNMLIKGKYNYNFNGFCIIISPEKNELYENGELKTFKIKNGKTI